MSYRPYPNPDRARHQLDRHADETPPLLWQPRPMNEFERRFFEGAAAAVRSAAPVMAAMVAGLKRPAGSEETST